MHVHLYTSPIQSGIKHANKKCSDCKQVTVYIINGNSKLYIENENNSIKSGVNNNS